MGDNINSKDFIIGTLIGGIVGASAALLFAPKSGKELRGDINQGASQMKDKAANWKDTAYDKSLELKDKAYKRGSELKDMAYERRSELTERENEKGSDVTEKA